VERGAEVYTNPMNTYPPVMQAAWKKHVEVVKYYQSGRATGVGRNCPQAHRA
jgi:hypothetical protein